MVLALMVARAETASDEAVDLSKAADALDRTNEDQAFQRRARKHAGRRRRQAAADQEALRRLEARLGRWAGRTRSGAPGHWLTPILNHLEEILHDIPGRWKLLAQLVRETEKMLSCSGENVRSRVNEFRRRSHRN